MASSDDKMLSGKGALITGGTRGIGLAVAEAYARAGARVFICGRNENSLAAALEKLRRTGAAGAGITGDIGDGADVERIADAALRHCGAIHVLVNNASMLGPREPIAVYPLADWNEVLRINLTGVFLITRAILPGMRRQRGGSIINVSSGVGRRGKARWGAYAVSKSGLEAFTQVLADEVSEFGIRVNSVNPAATRTAMRAAAYPLEDPQTLPLPEEIVPVFLYLASDESAAINGQSLEARDWLLRGKD
jgi:NAD(P)-dependent dehydrogenase (short-subunit alcohol dehydrogenase family)